MVRRRLRRTKASVRAFLGYTLVEVIVAMLISCVMVTAMFAVALSTKRATGKSDRHLIAAQAARQITSQLKSYVTGCGCSTAANGTCSSTNNDCSFMTGPNTCRSGVATWYIGCPTATPTPIVDSRGDVYALSAGLHVVTGLLPAWFEAAPYNATVQYTVTIVGTTPQVVVNVNWTEPP
ncbi:MAG: prepilin-type N-terminal cleavage/methylation domain-containing protein [Elusimicrobia bacterium]|nr:prepilin-type N-terminal cleavage/methylation domain-containing protein [Elusimicrobiota bacterium]